MTQTDWHVPEAHLRRFTEDPRSIDDATASSIEAHLVACAACRAAMAAAAPSTLVASSWEAIVDRIDRPRVSLVERVLERVGVPGGTARLLAATAGLRAAGLGGVVVVATAAAVASRTAGADGPFLLLAPVVPLLAVAASFASGADPAGEVGVATPVHGVGLVARRATLVLGATFVLLALAASALPDLGPASAAWVLPALALALGALGLATWMRVEVAAAGLLGLWLVAVPTVRWMAGQDVSYASSPAFTAAGQATSVLLAAIGAAALVLRRDRFAQLEVRR